MSRGVCLVIEDDEDIVGLITMILSQEGFEVRVTRTGAEALTQARGLNPALITLDLGLPDTDGLHIARELKELTAAPLLMLTARAAVTDELNGLAAGATAYLTKPFHANDLRVAVTTLCPAHG